MNGATLTSDLGAWSYGHAVLAVNPGQTLARLIEKISDHLRSFFRKREKGSVICLHGSRRSQERIGTICREDADIGARWSATAGRALSRRLDLTVQSVAA